ncbi:hypothetical protein J4217_01695 [Candidatus Pacearchaeota archaeon]|nr:hypothetical protein [Candidatus Pacearchaeota archaeon]
MEIRRAVAAIGLAGLLTCSSACNRKVEYSQVNSREPIEAAVVEELGSSLGYQHPCYALVLTNQNKTYRLRVMERTENSRKPIICLLNEIAAGTNILIYPDEWTNIGEDGMGSISSESINFSPKAKKE